MDNLISAQAPGRVCLFGDHQDYLGLPVIAATIDRYVFVNATPYDDQYLEIHLLDFDSKISIGLDENLAYLKPRDYFRSGLKVLAQQGIRITSGYQIRLWGDIPIQAGLSSSSALVVAWIRLLLKIAAPQTNFTSEQIARWSYEAEVCSFDEPGGLMDQYTIALGGLLYLDTVSGAHQRLHMDFESVVVVDSGIPKNTLQVLSQCKTLALKALAIIQKKIPNFELKNATQNDYESTVNELPTHLRPYWYAAIFNHLVTQKAYRIIQEKNSRFTDIATEMNAHQHILQNQIGNTPKAMIDMMQVAKKNGALGQKIVGSGGGGCFIALATSPMKNQLIASLKPLGVRNVFPVQITPPIS